MSWGDERARSEEKKRGNRGDPLLSCSPSMATLWEHLVGRARAGALRFGEAKAASSLGGDGREGGPRYLAVVARDRPDLVSRVHRLFPADQKVEAILDRRQGERRRGTAAPVADRRRADRRRPPGPDGDVSVNKVVIAAAVAPAIPRRLSQWLAEGRDALGGLGQVLAAAADAARELDELRRENAALRSENAALRARHAEMSGTLDRLARDLTRPLAEIVERLRVA